MIKTQKELSEALKNEAIKHKIIETSKNRSEGFIPLWGYVSPRVRGRWGVGHRREFFRRRTIYPPSEKMREI